MIMIYFEICKVVVTIGKSRAISRLTAEDLKDPQLVVVPILRAIFRLKLIEFVKRN